MTGGKFKNVICTLARFTEMNFQVSSFRILDCFLYVTFFSMTETATKWIQTEMYAAELFCGTCAAK